MTDLCIGPMGNPFTVYVAITRVQGRGKLLIFRPFDAAPFQKGIGLGRDLLLRHLRGDAINWQALLAKYCEERVCSTCAERKQSTAFTPGQWKRSDTDRVCRERTKHYADAGTPWQCNVCKLWHVEANFPEKHRQRQCSFFRVCLRCEMKKPCFKCGVAKPEAEFGPAAWKLATRTAAAAENVPPNSGAVGNVPSAANASHEQSSQLGSKVGNMRRMVHKYMQCMHRLCLRVSSCSSHESTLGPLAPTRNEPATRSNPSRRLQGDSENARS